MKRIFKRLTVLVALIGLFALSSNSTYGGALSWEVINSVWDGTAWQVLERCQGSGSTCEYEESGQLRALTIEPE